MSDWKFHCDVLCVPESASPEEIKRSYRKLALRFHPDRNGGTQQSKEKFQRLNISYQYLTKNINFRPRVEQPQSAPPPPPRPSPKKDFKTSPIDGGGSLQKILRKLKRHPAYARAKKLSVDSAARIFSAAVIAFAATMLVSTYLNKHSSEPIREPASAPSIQHSALCERMQFKPGSKVNKWSEISTEGECQYKCEKWLSGNLTFDETCIWNGKEFRQAKAKTNDPPADPEEVLANIRNIESIPDPIVFILNDIPDLPANLPFEHRIVSRTSQEVIDFDFKPRIWIDNTRVVHGEQGRKPNQVKFNFPRVGESSVVISDEKGNLKGHILYTIER